MSPFPLFCWRLFKSAFFFCNLLKFTQNHMFSCLYALQPIICINPACMNRKKWALLRQESKFADWQRVRMQETSKEIPAGSLPRSLDVILRHEIVEQARAGDTYVHIQHHSLPVVYRVVDYSFNPSWCNNRVIFTGSVVVIPDILALASPGERSECRREASQRKIPSGAHEGVKGLKALGVRDLSYRLAFIANSVQVCYSKLLVIIIIGAII